MYKFKEVMEMNMKCVNAHLTKDGEKTSMSSDECHLFLLVIFYIPLRETIHMHTLY